MEERETAFEKIYDGRWDEESLLGAIKWLTECLNEIPEEYREKAQIDVDVNEYSLDIAIGYWRPETDAEMFARLSRKRQYLADQESRQRAEYEKLKAKFEGGASK